MTPLKSLIAAGVLLLPAVGVAATETTRCYAAHFVRNVGPSGATPDIPVPQELRQTVIFFNNGNLVEPAVIQRLTVRSPSGAILHDSGPKVGVPHPLNMGQNITTVQPGGTLGFGTGVLFGNSSPAGGFSVGSAMSVTVEVSTPTPWLVVVHARENSRELVPSGGPGMPGSLMQGPERSANVARCFRIRDRDDG